MNEKIRVALVHDYLAQDGGAEEMLRIVHRLFPDAPIFVLFNKAGSVRGLDDAQIRESLMTKFPFARRFYRYYLPFMPFFTKKHKLPEVDLVISLTSAFAKAVPVPAGATHVCYCHTPPRFIWGEADKYIADLPNNFLVKKILPKVIDKLKKFDLNAAVNNVDFFVANSQTVAGRMERYYARDSVVIYPPIDISKFDHKIVKKDFFVTGGRLVPYKMFHLTIEAFNRLGWPLKVFGAGPEEGRLKRMARSNIEFLGRISDVERNVLLAEARAFIHPQTEDLGITAIEPMAAGTPVFAYGEGGATETVVHGETGWFFHDQSALGLVQSLLIHNPEELDREKIRRRATQFSLEKFEKDFLDYVRGCMLKKENHKKFL